MSKSELHVKVDVVRVAEEELPEGEFPALYPHVPYRVCFSPDAYERMREHAHTDTQIELCGVLVGDLLKDGFGPFAVIKDVILGHHAQNRGTQVTFTQETWAHVYHELDSGHRDRRILGWYHTHPRFGIFLSPMDLFIQESFFNLPWQIAFVIDPVSSDEGLFEWQNGKTVLASQYWVGSVVHFSARRGAPGPTSAPAVLPERLREMPQPVEPTEGRVGPSKWWDAVEVLLLLLVLVALLFRSQADTIGSRLVSWIEGLLSGLHSMMGR